MLDLRDTQWLQTLAQREGVPMWVASRFRSIASELIVLRVHAAGGRYDVAPIHSDPRPQAGETFKLTMMHRQDSNAPMDYLVDIVDVHHSFVGRTHVVIIQADLQDCGEEEDPFKFWLPARETCILRRQ